MTKPKLTHEERSNRRTLAVQDVAAGADLAVVAAKHNLGVTYLRMLCAQAKVRPVKRRSDLCLGIAAALQNEPEATMAAVAERFGVTRQRVHQVLVQAELAGFRFPGRRRWSEDRN